MKRIIIIFLFTLATSAQLLAQKNDWVQITGNLKGFDNRVMLEDLSEFQYLLPPDPALAVVPDAQGNFKLKFKLLSPNYFRLGSNILYLSPGDNLDLALIYRERDSAIFKGTGAEENSYLKGTPLPKAGSFLMAGMEMQDTPEASIAHMEELAHQRKLKLDSLKHISTEFRKLENARIRADLINSICAIRIYAIVHKGLKGEKVAEFTTSYRKLAQNKIQTYCRDFTDASLMKLVVYRDVMDSVVKYGVNQQEIKTINEWKTADKIVREMSKEDKKEKIRSYTEMIDSLSTPHYKRAVTVMQKFLLAFGKGDRAVDFVASDDQGNRVKLSSLKGKVIYVDLWATWCGPCILEMPAFEQLKQKYSNNPGIVFVSLSIDDGGAIWKKNLLKRKASGYQWLINRNLLSAYNIVNIPRALLIDSDFNVVSINAPLPSEKQTAEVIDNLLKTRAGQ